LPPPLSEFLHFVQDDKWGMEAKESGVFGWHRGYMSVIALVGVATPAGGGLAMGACILFL